MLKGPLLESSCTGQMPVHLNMAFCQQFSVIYRVKTDGNSKPHLLIRFSIVCWGSTFCNPAFCIKEKMTTSLRQILVRQQVKNKFCVWSWFAHHNALFCPRWTVAVVKQVTGYGCDREDRVSRMIPAQCGWLHLPRSANLTPPFETKSRANKGKREVYDNHA